jgi:hypothetical protein
MPLGRQARRRSSHLRKKGDDVRAHGYFKRAYDISHTPRSAAQLGLVEQAIGDFLHAEMHLSEALASDDAWVRSNEALLQDSRTVVRSQIGAVEVKGAPAGAKLEAAGRPPFEIPTDGVVWVQPGESFLVISAAGYQAATRKVNVAAGARITMDVELQRDGTATSAKISQPLPPSPGPEHDGAHRTLYTGLALAGVGLAAAATGVFLYRDATMKLDAIRADAMAMPPRPYDEGNGNWRTMDRAGVGLMVGGAVAVAAGAALLVASKSLGSSRSASADYPIRVAVSPLRLPGVQLEARF